MNKNILIGVVILVIIAAALYYFLVIQKAGPEITPLERERGLGKELLSNPGTLVPETNPYKNVQTNPLEGTNPFEGGYKNPFGE